MNANEIKIALEELIAGKHTVEDILHYRETDPEEFDKTLEFNIPRLGGREADASVFEVAWMAFGAKRCMSIFPSMPRQGLDRFFTTRLMSHPVDFDDDCLDQLCQVRLPDSPIVRQVAQIRRNRIKDKIERQRAESAEFATDSQSVRRQARKYSFPPKLIELLDKAESGFGKGDEFDCAGTITHLRTFLERLTEAVVEGLHEKDPQSKDGTNVSRFGQSIEFLERRRLIDTGMYRLGKGLYAVLSEEGAHAISSDLEYVRLCRNMVIEFALVLFWELDRWEVPP